MQELNERIGALASWKQTPTGLAIATNNATLEATVYEAGIIRININQLNRDFSGHSYAVVAEPANTDFSVEDTPDALWLRTASTHLRIDKAPVALTFLTTDGKVINEDFAPFGTSWIGTEVTTYKQPQEGERFVGLGEKNGNLDRRGTALTNWNTDKFAYSVEDDPLYLSTPFYMGVHSGLAYGLFLDNTHKTIFNFGASNDRFVYFSAESGSMNYYLVYGETVPEILGAYSRLTGTMPLPPKWSLGLHQCRYSYYPDSEVINVARTFREKDIPADVVYLDIHYMQDYKVFTFDKDRFPDPKGMAEKLEELDFNLAVIVDPGVKREEGYETYESGMKAGIFANYPDGVPYAGEVWPGWSYFPDYTKPEGRQWWADQFEQYTEVGITGFWNDMNEPATWGQHLPNLIEFAYEGEGATHRKARNVYGMNMARSTYDGTRKFMKGNRPFILTRAGFSGIQRYAAVWTGDNVSSDENMMGGVRLLLSMGLTGIPFAGFDCGGFAGEASPALFARWISIGAFSPFFRCHSMVNTRDAEPWAFGEEVEQISRNYIKLRYALMPYIYSAFHNASQTGLPVMRSLAVDHTHDTNIYDTRWQHQYLFGTSILVAPVESTKELCKVYLPKGTWYNLFTDEQAAGNQIIVAECPMWQLPLFVKGGSIIPMQSDVASLKQAPTTELLLHVYLGNGTTSYDYYEDDGTTYEHLDGTIHQRTIVLDSDAGTLTFSACEGLFNSHFETVRVFFHGVEKLDGLELNGNPVAVQTEDHSFFTPISGIDTFYSDKGNDLHIKELPSAVVPYSSNAFELQF